MSIGPFGGVVGSAAGAPLSQSKGSETDSSTQAGAAKRQTDAAEKAEAASGIGTTEEDQQAGDRDANGQRMYEDVLEIESTDEEDELNGETPPPTRKPDTDDTGSKLDLLG